MKKILSLITLLTLVFSLVPVVEAGSSTTRSSSFSSSRSSSSFSSKPSSSFSSKPSSSSSSTKLNISKPSTSTTPTSKTPTPSKTPIKVTTKPPAVTNNYYSTPAPKKTSSTVVVPVVVGSGMSGSGGYYPQYMVTSSGRYLYLIGYESDGDPRYVYEDTGVEVDDDDLQSLGAKPVETRVINNTTSSAPVCVDGASWGLVWFLIILLIGMAVAIVIMGVKLHRR